MRQIMGFPQENLPASRVYSTKATSPASTRRSILRVLLPDETSSLALRRSGGGAEWGPRSSSVRRAKLGGTGIRQGGCSGTELELRGGADA